MSALFFSSLSFLCTFVGGIVGLRFKDRLHLILGFTAGVLLGVVAFDILPEISDQVVHLGLSFQIPMIALVAGFLTFHIVEKTLLVHHSHESQYGEHHHPSVGIASAIALIGHSFLDGVGIGLAFQVSLSAGLLVTLAVIAHDFSDGLNTVSLMLAHENTEERAFTFLAFDAFAPVLGALSTLFFTIPAHLLPLYLGFFAGFLLYIGASDILPEAHAKHSSYVTIFMTILGSVFIYGITSLLS